ncbi:PREDICTED: protein SPT2 homolog isoform X2 [Eufriesea mexicana]|uniref:protein SPT2 homolog isoform X2 n=1 Tax=Eufriesea mexicana TaxID=516756 RepID=UPI00083C2112|nr:PREDICTED: protein SPT2 homolog isoform X2 [Eufriesea mexicana]
MYRSPSQPDEDDYGYVSQEASALYNQLMSKYNNTTSQKTTFNECRKKTIKDIASTKDRVKQALKQQEVEEALGHRRKRKLSVKEVETEPEEKVEKDVKDDKKEKEEKSKAKRKPMPPPIDFTELLKIAEKKQHEPIIIEVKPKNEEPERLLTKKQMKEYAKEKEWRERKEQRNKLGNASSKGNEGNVVTVNKPSKAPDNRNNSSNKIPKIAEKVTSSPVIPNKIPSKVTNLQSSTWKKGMEKSNISKPSANKCNVSKTSERDILLEERKKLETERKKLEEMRQAIEEEKKKLRLSKTQNEEVKNTKPEKCLPKIKVPEKQELSKNVNKEPAVPKITKPRVPLNDEVKQFPPADLKPIKPKQIPQKKTLVNHKRLIKNEAADDEEYDSELEDFIDDEVEEHSEDYSRYISEIFGYDKNKYKFVDNEDDVAMESSFAQQLKEEYVSTKIGIMEDLEDMRIEALEKKRKARLKGKLKK